MGEVERFDSYQELLSELEERKKELAQIMNDKRVQLDQLITLCDKLRDAIEYEHRLYKSVERTAENGKE